MKREESVEHMNLLKEFKECMIKFDNLLLEAKNKLIGKEFTTIKYGINDKGVPDGMEAKVVRKYWSLTDVKTFHDLIYDKELSNVEDYELTVSEGEIGSMVYHKYLMKPLYDFYLEIQDKPYFKLFTIINVMSRFETTELYNIVCKFVVELNTIAKLWFDTYIYPERKSEYEITSIYRLGYIPSDNLHEDLHFKRYVYNVLLMGKYKRDTNGKYVLNDEGNRIYEGECVFDDLNVDSEVIIGKLGEYIRTRISSTEISEISVTDYITNNIDIYAKGILKCFPTTVIDISWLKMFVSIWNDRVVTYVFNDTDQSHYKKSCVYGKGRTLTLELLTSAIGKRKPQ